MTTVTVTFEPMDGGGLRAYSNDVPGFVLSHYDDRVVLAGVIPALKAILTVTHKKPMTVKLISASMLNSNEPQWYAGFST